MSRAESNAVKHFVLDTNVLLHNPNALFMFTDNVVVIPLTVIEEIDQFKKNTDDTGRNARQAIRHLDRLRTRGKLSEGVEWNDHGGKVMVDLGKYEATGLLCRDEPDNRIIAVASHHQSLGHITVFVSKDMNARIKSDALGIETMDFEAQRVDVGRLYQGYQEVLVPRDLIDQFYQDKQISKQSLIDAAAQVEAASAVSHSETEGVDELASDDRPALATLYGNQFVLLKDIADPAHTGLGRYEAEQEVVVPVRGLRRTVFGVMPRNLQQTIAMALLLDERVKLVTLLGTAGSGKTLLALAAGLDQTVNEQMYERLLVARPIMPMGRDLGYLPGDIDAKLGAWMQPIFDNMNYLLSTRGAGKQEASSQTVEQRLEALKTSGQVVLEPLTYIRGRSIPNQWMIVDEAQNLTPHEVKTIVSRVGEGTKLILTGDIEQIDNPYLDSSSNGLSYLVEQLKGEAMVGHVMLKSSERSALASLAADRL